MDTLSNSNAGGSETGASAVAIQQLTPVSHASALTGPRRGNLLAVLAEAPAAAGPAPRRGTATRREQEPPSGEASDEGSDEVDDTPSVYGNLKTSLVWDTAGRRLCLAARQYAETGRRLEVKARGMLDTASGQHRLVGHVRRNFYTHVPLLQRLLAASAQRAAGGWVDEPDLDPNAFLPGGLKCLLFQDWAIAPGLSYDTARAPPLPPPVAPQPPASPGGSTSGSAGGAAAAPGPYGGGPGGGGGCLVRAGLPALVAQRVRYQLALKKNPQVLVNTPRADLWLQARALAEFDPKASEVTLSGALRLKAVRYGVTGGQDLRLAAGFDLTPDSNGRLQQTPYLHVSDGKLGARLQHRRWQLTYTL